MSSHRKPIKNCRVEKLEGTEWVAASGRLDSFKAEAEKLRLEADGGQYRLVARLTVRGLVPRGCGYIIPRRK